MTTRSIDPMDLRIIALAREHLQSTPEIDCPEDYAQFLCQLTEMNARLRSTQEPAAIAMTWALLARLKEYEEIACGRSQISGKKHSFAKWARIG